jgi:CubicO group peptidase (beta-lactamase class C family)
MPGVWTPKPGMYLDRLQELFEASIANVHGEVPPGTRCDYSPLVNHVLMGTALVRTDPKGRNYQTLLHEDLFAPLGMNDTSMGLRADLASRHVKPDMRGTVPIQHLSRNLPGDHALFEDPEVEAPHVGCASTSGDLYRFAEMLRRGGELDGVCILSPAMLKLARQNHTGTMPNELYKRVAENAGWEVPPANQGIGFQVRGSGVFHHLFGTLASPETHGNYGAGSTMFWVDPVADVSFALCSAGVMTQAANIERCQKLSDLALSAML